ncbi:MAG: hypothetical protein LUF86_02630, partial [Clostridiales bacterium]|nr:hypothetical protein [Clostridiales bacterium]
NYHNDEQGIHAVFESACCAVSQMRASRPVAADWSRDIDEDYQRRSGKKRKQKRAIDEAKQASKQETPLRRHRILRCDGAPEG